MTRLSFKCDCCGGKMLKVPGEENIYKCIYCGNKQIIKDDSDNLDKHQQSSLGDAYGIDEKGYSKLISAGETYLDLQDYKRAKGNFEMAVDRDPSQYIGWWLLAKCKICMQIDKIKNGGLDYIDTDYEQDFKNAIKLANESDAKLINNQYSKLVSELYGLKNYDNSTEEKEGTYGTIEANLGKERNDKIISNIILIIFIVISVSAIITSFINHETISSIVINFLLIFAGVFGLVDNVEKYRVINCIKKHNDISLRDLMTEMGKDYNEMKVRDRFFKNIERSIKTGYLCNYKYENGHFKKVS